MYLSEPQLSKLDSLAIYSDQEQILSLGLNLQKINFRTRISLHVQRRFQAGCARNIRSCPQKVALRTRGAHSLENRVGSSFFNSQHSEDR